jgi:chromosome segregation ATPase
LELSARIGTDLLNSNRRLATEVEEWKQINEESQKFFANERKKWEEKSAKDEQRINELEEAIRIHETTKVIEKSDDKLDRHQEKRFKDLEKEIMELSKDKEEYLRKFEQMEGEKRHWVKEKIDLNRELKEQSLQSPYQEELEMAAQKIDELEKTHHTIQQALELSTEKLRFYEKNFEDYDIVKEELEYLRVDREHQANHIVELNAALESSKEAIQMLHQRLTGKIGASILSTTQPSMTEEDEEKAGRSLFTEVEDRRVEIERRHKQLQENYGSLMRQHAETRHQKERLKNHVTRLAQLAQHHNLQEKLERLEKALSVKESELIQVYSRIEGLETELAEFKYGRLTLDDLPYDERIAETFSLMITSEMSDESKKDAIHYLQRRTEYMNYEVLWLRNQVKQLRSLKCIHEAKLRELEVDLTRRDVLLDQAQREYTQLRHESEESFLRIRELEAHIDRLMLFQEQSTPSLSKKSESETLQKSFQYSSGGPDPTPFENKENAKGHFDDEGHHPTVLSSDKFSEKLSISPSRLIPHIKASSLPSHSSCVQQ